MALTSKGKKFFIGLGLAAILIVGYFTFPLFTKGDSKISFTGSTNEPDVTVAYNTFIGAAGALLMNDGTEVNENSEFYKKYGLKVKIKQMDAVKDTRSGLISGDLDIAYCTTDAFSTETGSGSELLSENIVEFAKINESRGADAIVVRKGITKVEDLKRKKIAYAVGTASHTLLLNVLESSGLKISDIDEYKVADGIEAATAFKNGQCDAALVWSPDDEDCLAAQVGSTVLISTAVASQIIADGVLVKQENIKAKGEILIKFIKGWLEGNARINSDPASRKKAVEVFSKAFNFPADLSAKAINKVYFCTLGDNINFFGLNTSYTGVTGDRMYGRMAVKYTEIGLTKSPAPWRSVSDPTIIEALREDKEFASVGNQQASKQEAFKVATEKVKTQVSQSSKTVSLEFETSSAKLDEDDKAIIDREVKELAQGFAGAYIRVEGNTDNTGNATTNDKLSLNRAKSVVEYLIAEHKFDPNKFIVVGNGSNKPVDSNDTEDGKARNRRTEFQFIWENK